MPEFYRSVRKMAVLAGFVLAAGRAGAQETRPSSERLLLGSRAAKAESVASVDNESARAEHRAEAEALRNRLRDGDFHAGDRITLTVVGEASLTNTFSVRNGNVLDLPGIGEVSLKGVLRSELQDVLVREISRYIREPRVQATVLVNVAVLGAVARPGFYAVGPDMPLSELLMAAGGPVGNADLRRSKIVRGNSEVVSPEQMRKAFDSNKTVDEVSAQSGDQITIGERTSRWKQVSGALSLAALIVPTIVLLRR